MQKNIQINQTKHKTKKILIGITGGIAAYKIPFLIRLIKKQHPGSDIKIICTPSALNFVTELTLQALSQNKIYHKLIDPEAELSMGHIELAQWADIILIAPASANTIAKLAHGIADNLLATVTLAAPKSTPIIISPAMNPNMWHDPRTQNNISILKKHFEIIPPDFGEQACGDIGLGRMPEPENILDILDKFINKNNNSNLKNKNILITAGPTQENIDPVRYITNHSSGKMGYALAEKACELGANVFLISGPVNINIINNKIKLNKIISAKQMLNKSINIIKNNNIDVFIAAAAVSDFTIKNQASHKKPKEELQNLELIKNPDILNNISNSINNNIKRPKICVGFAAQDTDVLNYAKNKLKNKNLDLCVANDISRDDIGFYQDNNEVIIIQKDLSHKLIAKNSKNKIAEVILQEIDKISCFDKILVNK